MHPGGFDRTWIALVRRSASRLLIPSILIAVAAVALDVLQWLRGAPLWVDEEMIALNVRDRSFAELAGTLWLGQSAPLGWLAAQRAAILLLGTGELVLRLLPLLFGIGTVAAAVWIGERWLGRLGAALLVLLFALAQWLSHFRFEVKHYSADAFWALLLPALAVWAVDRSPGGDGLRRRWTVWWLAAAMGLWFANGALLVAPGCAVFLLAVILQRHGPRAAAHFAIAGGIWLLSFGINYAVSLQYTHHNRYLRAYWASEVPPAGAGLLEVVRWTLDRLGPLADNPAGTALAAGLWGGAVLGFALGSPRLLGAVFATVPLTAVVLSGMRLVPLHDRFSLWIVPALYVGIALLFSRGVRDLRSGWRTGRSRPALIGALLTLGALPVSADIVTRGWRNLDLDAPSDNNHALDDRTAVRWLMQRRQPGDALITTRLGWPAIWWYGGIPLRATAPGGRLRDGTVMYEVSHERDPARCAGHVERLFQDHRRVLVYIGFPDMPEAFHEILFRDFGRFGTLVEFDHFVGLSRVAVFESRPPGSLRDDHEVQPPRRPHDDSAREDCVAVRIARRW